MSKSKLRQFLLVSLSVLVCLRQLRSLLRKKELLYNERMKELLAIVVGVNIVIWGLVLIMSMQSV